MNPLPVIVSGVLASGLLQRSLTEENHAIETPILDRPVERLGVGVRVGRTMGQAYDLEAGIAREIPKRQRELGVPLEDRESLLGEGSVERFGEVATDLHHPGSVWARGDPGDLDAAGRELDSVLFQDVADRGAPDSMI